MKLIILVITFSLSVILFGQVKTYNVQLVQDSFNSHIDDIDKEIVFEMTSTKDINWFVKDDCRDYRIFMHIGKDTLNRYKIYDITYMNSIKNNENVIIERTFLKWFMNEFIYINTKTNVGKLDDFLVFEVSCE